MNFVVIGGGAVGGYFGGRLAQHGEDVAFIARDNHLHALQKQGLIIESIIGDFHLNDIKATSYLSNETRVDVIIVAVKSFQLVGVIEQIKVLLSEHTKVIPLLNGVNTLERLVAFGIPEKHLLGGLAKIISRVKSPGIIQHTGATPHITLGLYQKNDNSSGAAIINDKATLDEILQRFKQSGISVGLTKNINLALWRKYLFVAAWGTLASLTRVPVGKLRKNKECRLLLLALLNEYRAIGQSLGVSISDDIVTETVTFIDSLPEHSETSMQRDIVNQQPSEFDTLTTYALNIAHNHKIDVPVLAYCHSCISVQLS